MMSMETVQGGGFTLLTDDPIMKAVVRRCAELDQLLTDYRHMETARLRTLRRDVRQIKAAIVRKDQANG
jgi:hypothetical protein